MQTIGITGGIGSGKSVISHLLRLMNTPVYDSDFEAKRLYETDAELAGKMKMRFGEDIYYNGKNKLNRTRLAEIIFKDPHALADTNALVHPAVTRHFEEWRHEQALQGYSLVAVESAILFESPLYPLVDSVWVVTAPEEQRLERAAKRDGVSSGAVAERIGRQMAQEEMIRRADAVISNDGSELLIPRIAGLLKQFR